MGLKVGMERLMSHKSEVEDPMFVYCRKDYNYHLKFYEDIQVKKRKSTFGLLHYCFCHLKQ